jgi:hypothetical protein
MEYKPSELADELGVAVKTIHQSWLPAGLPFRRDKTNHIWIVGTEARAWLDTIATQSIYKPKKKLEAGQAYCIKCKKAVTPIDATRRRFGKAGMLKGRCPACGQELRKLIKASEINPEDPIND